MSEHPVQKSHRTPGRAAQSNPDVRFDRISTETIDDGWEQADEPPVLRTQVGEEVAREIMIVKPV